MKQVRDFRPFIQRTVESHSDILSRGLATSELRLRQVSEACNREDGFEDCRPGGWALTHPAGDFGGRGRLLRSQDCGALVGAWVWGLRKDALEMTPRCLAWAVRAVC